MDILPDIILLRNILRHTRTETEKQNDENEDGFKARTGINREVMEETRGRRINRRGEVMG